MAEKQGSVEGLYYEATDSDLYWTCSNDASINRINPNTKDGTGKLEKVLKLNSHDKPRGIAVDPCESRIFFTNWNPQSPSIQRSFKSGYQLESIITVDIRMPNGLTLDHAAKKLYWVSYSQLTNQLIIFSQNTKFLFFSRLMPDWTKLNEWNTTAQTA